LCGQIPVRLDRNSLKRLRIAVVPQRRPTRWGYVWRLRLHPGVVQDAADIGSVRDERNQANLPTALRTQQREHFVDTRYQHAHR